MPDKIRIKSSLDESFQGAQVSSGEWRGVRGAMMGGMGRMGANGTARYARGLAQVPERSWRHPKAAGHAALQALARLTGPRKAAERLGVANEKSGDI